METLAELGLLERFLERPHSRIARADLRLAGREWRIAELSRLPTAAPFIAMMPQWEFLDFLREEARSYAGFNLEMRAPVDGFIEEQGKIRGVRLRDGREARARLTIAADGRRSIARGRLPLKALGVPIDVLWFNVPKQRSEEGSLCFAIDGAAIVVLMDRDTYWQCAFVIPKGSSEALMGEGLDAVRARLRAAAPDMDLGQLKATTDFKLLTVTLDRLTRWDTNGLLAIGDAAHAMSPIGGVGINLAIQDAVAAANVLAGALAAGEEVDAVLHKVRRRRLWPTRFMQRAQQILQDRIIWPLLCQGETPRAPLIARLFHACPPLRSVPGRLMGLGVRRERVRSPYSPALANKVATLPPLRRSSSATRRRPSK
jgi:2-polyprenyl-6-methoxyphenol hydroxylase-like FAD-dependent oxidoreductase